jgi:predicted O-linked N-acetylglucosamine transferase (SPINDLY family)
MTTVAEALALAAQHHRAGKLAGAEQIYRQVLHFVPDSTDALNALGITLAVQGRLGEAESCFREALRLRPDLPEVHNNLGNLLKQQGALAQAESSFRQALRLRPENPDAHNNLGTVLIEEGRFAEAETCHREALRLRSDFAEGWYNLGLALAAQQKLAEALACYEQALRFKPDFAEALANRGKILQQLGQYAQAEVSYRQTLSLRPELAEVHSSLGAVLTAQGKGDAALAAYEEALRLRPDDADAWTTRGALLAERGRHADAEASLRQALRLRPDKAWALNCLGAVLADRGQFDEALASFQHALRLQPDFADAQCNLGVAFSRQGRLKEALDALRRALEIQPDAAPTHSSYFYFLHFAHADDRELLAREAQRWQERHAGPLEKLVVPHSNVPDPDRRLRIGYVSPDFRWHPVGRFLLPLLECQDRAAFKSFCYSSVIIADELTERLRAHADQWRDVASLGDERLTELICRDSIDILVDLSAHMGQNRLLVFARKPAPVQVTFLGYCSTTGLRTMDYRLSDPYMDPPEAPTPYYSEQTVWLPDTYFCFRPERELPPPSPLPALACGQVTFGCFNNLLKVNASVLSAWCELLRRVPHSRLLLYAPASPRRDSIRAFLAREGLDPARVEYVGYTPPAEYFQLYDRIDIALDPFPYTGGTTTCDALWMGVPTVSLVGMAPVCRMGLSVLVNAGFREWAVGTLDEYIHVVTKLAADLPSLAALRGSMRERVARSLLADAPRYTCNVEAAFRSMWRSWCDLARSGG